MAVNTAFTRSYCWLFPKRDCSWVGVGGTLGSSKDAKLQTRLAEFIERRDDLRGRRIRHRGGGLVPSDLAEEFVAHGAMVVGDAAGLVNPMTGGGIAFALASGEIAGRVAAEAIRRGRNDRSFLRKYPRQFRLTPHYVWLIAMAYLRRRLDRKPPDKQPVAYARMLRRYMSFFHHARRLVDVALGFHRS